MGINPGSLIDLPLDAIPELLKPVESSGSKDTGLDQSASPLPVPAPVSSPIGLFDPLPPLEFGIKDIASASGQAQINARNIRQAISQ